jgi:hypothetical protein
MDYMGDKCGHRVAGGYVTDTVSTRRVAGIHSSSYAARGKLDFVKQSGNGEQLDVVGSSVSISFPIIH